MEKWSCRGCSYYHPLEGCKKKDGCDFIPVMIFFEQLLLGNKTNNKIHQRRHLLAKGTC